MSPCSWGEEWDNKNDGDSDRDAHGHGHNHRTEDHTTPMNKTDRYTKRRRGRMMGCGCDDGVRMPSVNEQRQGWMGPNAGKVPTMRDVCFASFK
jgi:hypothetical protein